jgi:hypothetical protein
MWIKSVFKKNISLLDDANIFCLQVHPDVRKYTLGARRTATTVEGLERQLMSPPVVATTCLSTDQYVDIFFSLWTSSPLQ